jgi:hypothetical protein
VKRLGPELKMPKLKGGEMKVPPFFSDLYADLRDRRLLPLVALILVAIVATPVLLAGGAEEAEPVPGPIAGAGGAVPAAQDLTVVKAAPGLRNYRKRLAHRSPTNPFKQRFAGPQGLKQAQLNSAPAPAPAGPTTAGGEPSSDGGTGTAPEPEGTLPEQPVEGSGGPSGEGKGGDSDIEGLPDGATFFSFVLDLEITRIETKPDGSVVKTGPTLHKDVEPPAALPGKKTPVLTYIGIGSKTHDPLFILSTEVTGAFGEAKCIAGTGTCQLIALEKGFPLTLVYGENGVRYKFSVVDMNPVVTSKP